jgi:plastocyanin
MRHPPRVAPLLLAVGLALAATACGGSGSGSSSGSDNEVKVIDSKFEPDQVKVGVGDTVTWSFQGNIDHNVTPVGDNRSTWKASKTQKDGTFEQTFEQAGTYAYICTIHPGMKGTVTVS